MRDEGTASLFALWVVYYAAIMMIIGGLFQAIEGLVALFQDTVIVTTRNYAFYVDATIWGGVHLALGVLVTAGGVYLFAGRPWARLVGIAVAILGAVSNFLFIPYYPIWSVLIIVVDVLALWALAYRGQGLAGITREDP